MMTSKTERRGLIELRPDLIQALGEVSARYGQIEHLLTMTIHRTAEIPYHEAIDKVEELRSGEKVRREAKRSFSEWAMREHGEVEGKECAKAFNDLIEHWAPLCDRRDDVIHCCWSVGTEDKQISGTRRGELLKWDGCVVGIQDVQKLADNLKQFVVRLNIATIPSEVSGPDGSLVFLSTPFSVDYIMPLGVETYATAAVDKPSEYVTERSND